MAALNLLLDLDGTLSDPKEGIVACILYALEKMGRPPPPGDSLEWCIGPPLWRSFATLLNTGERAEADRAVAYYRERFGKQGVRENRPYPGISQALATLSTTATLYLATSKPTVYAAEILARDGFRVFFRRVYGSGLNGVNTEKGDLIRHILRREKLPPQSVAMVGDREYDIIGALENGVAAYGVAWGFGSDEELNAAGARKVFATPAEMVSFFSGNAAD